MWRQVNLHLLEVESLLPVDAVGVACNNRDSPGINRVSLCTEGETRVLACILKVRGLISWSGEGAEYGLIVLVDVHVHHFKNVGLEIVEDQSADLHGVLADQAVVHVHIHGALLGPLIVPPVGSGPRAGTEARQGAILIVNDFSPGLLIADLDQHIIEGESRGSEGTCT